MKKAVWNNQAIAESDRGIVVEGDYYFPPEDIHEKYFKRNNHHTTCPWKGEASYYDVVVDGKVNENAAWYYPQPKEAARNIANYVAFWKGVRVADA